MRARAAPVLTLVALSLGMSAAWAQRSGLTITPTFSATLELTDNRNLSATNREADAIATLSPGIRISSRSGALQGSLDLSLNSVTYARDSSSNTVELRTGLASSFSAEVVDRHVFIDVSARISPQPVSAFGLQGDRATNSNTTDYLDLTISPSLRGRLFGLADVEARLTSNYSGSVEDGIGKNASHNASLSIGESLGAVGWSVAASRSYTDYEDGRATISDRVTPQISYTFYPGLRVFVSGGYERNDILTFEPTTYNTWGGGFSWQPTPRTQVSAQTEQRYFGSSWNVSMSHRMRRAVVTYTDSKSDDQRTTGSGASLSTYDLFYTQFASIEPDPALREVLVRNYLQAAGLNPNQQLSAGFISKAASVQRSQNLSLGLQGRRNNLVLSAFATATERVDTLSQAQDDLSQVDTLHQQGVSLSLSHRLTASAAVVLFGSVQRTPSSGSVQGNDLSQVSLSWTDTLGPRSSLSVTGRYTRATGGNPYTENSLLATFSYSF